MILVDAWKGFKKIAWFLPGFILYAAFPPMCEGVDVLFALAPLLWLARQGKAKESAKRWFQSGLFFWAATLSWMPAIIKNNGPWPLVLLGWVALAVYCSLYFAAFGYLSARYWAWANGRFRFLGILLVEPVLWCGLELVRSRLGGGFAWNQLGVVPVNFGFGAPAALGGVYLCSAVVILINGTFAGIAERVISRVRDPWRSLETIFAFALIWAIYAVSAPAPAPVVTPERTLKVALVQRNFPCCFKEQAEDPMAVYSNLLANVALLKPDLAILPESAMSEFGLVDRGAALRFVHAARAQLGDAAILAGGTRREGDRIFNSAALYWPMDEGRSTGLDVMDKVHLVPFGEFIPGDKLFPFLQKFAPVGSCTPGIPRTLSLTTRQSAFKLKLGVAICYEDTDSALMRRYSRMGADFLCFITNDSWFSNSNEALAHAWQATARAIETGLPVVRVGNSGVTGIITSEGKTNWLLGADGKVLVDRSGTMFDRLPVASVTPSDFVRTPYVRVGDYPLGLLFLLLILAQILVKYMHRKDLRNQYL